MFWLYNPMKSIFLYEILVRDVQQTNKNRNRNICGGGGGGRRVEKRSFF